MIMNDAYKFDDLKGKYYTDFQKKVEHDIICNRDLSESGLYKITFSNCTFKEVGFSGAYCENLIFEDCSLINISFRKAELDQLIFKNCQLTSVSFNRTDLSDSNFSNCTLNDVTFCAAELIDIKFENSSLQKIVFAAEFDNVRIKDSTLTEIQYLGSKVYTKSLVNGKLEYTNTLIRDYESFLKAVS